MIYVIIGTRAQLIKMAPLIRNLEKKDYLFTLIHTGQHIQSLDEICKDFDIETKWHSLYYGKEVSTIPLALFWCLSMSTQLISNKFHHQFVQDNTNNLILVHGDTLSTLIGAALGKRFRMTVVHIESGLRSFNLTNPFPEELTRLLAFRMSDIAFCPSDWALNNLKKYPNLETVNTNGNTIIDSLNFISEKKSEYSIPEEDFGVISIHRFENIFFRKRFATIIQQIILLANQYKLVFVLHPTTKKRLQKTGLLTTLKHHSNIDLRERTGYKNFISLLTTSKFVISDGGSNQEELAIIGTPTYLMRQSTERQDGLDKNIVLGRFSVEKLNHFINNLENYCYPSSTIKSSPSEIIISSLKKYLLKA